MELQISTLFSCAAGTLWVQKVQKHLEDRSKKSEYDTAVRDNATKNKGAWDNLFTHERKRVENPAGDNHGNQWAQEVKLDEKVT